MRPNVKFIRYFWLEEWFVFLSSERYSCCTSSHIAITLITITTNPEKNANTNPCFHEIPVVMHRILSIATIAGRVQVSESFFSFTLYEKIRPQFPESAVGLSHYVFSRHTHLTPIFACRHCTSARSNHLTTRMREIDEHVHSKVKFTIAI